MLYYLFYNKTKQIYLFGWKNNDLYFIILLDMCLMREKSLVFKNKRILIIWLFMALFLFSELVLPLNSAFCSTFYDDEIEYECCELCQNSYANHINIDKKNEDEIEVEEIEDDSFLYSLSKKEKQFYIIQNCNLNLESILSTYPQIFKIILFAGKLKQKNNIDTCPGNENTLVLLRTVVLVI